jgi:inner membrane transporter RhtA
MEGVLTGFGRLRGSLGVGRRPMRVRSPVPHPRVASQVGGPVLIVGASASLQCSAALATTLFAAYGPVGTGALRFGFAAPLLCLLVRPRLCGRSGRFWSLVGLDGAAMVGLNFALYEAIGRAPLGTVVTLQFLGPLALALLGARRPVDALWAILAAVGVVLLTGGPAAGSPLGLAFALLAAGMTVISLVVSRRLATESAGLDGLALAVAFAAFLCLPLAIRSVVTTPAPEDLLLAAAVAVLAIAVPYPLEYVAIRRVSLRTFGVILSLDPAIAGLVGIILLGQRLDQAGLLGIAAVVVASAGAMVTTRDS